MQIKEDVFHLSLQPQWIASPEICVILHILLKPNSIIVSLFIQNSFKFLTSLPPRRPTFFGLFFGTVSGCKDRLFLADTPQKVDNIHGAVCFTYSCFLSVQF